MGRISARRLRLPGLRPSHDADGVGGCGAGCRRNFDAVTLLKKHPDELHPDAFALVKDTDGSRLCPFCAAAFYFSSNSPFTASTVTVWPGVISPRSSRLESMVSTVCWT